MGLINFFSQHQINIMLVLSGICGIMAFLICIFKAIPKRKKPALILMEIGAMLLLVFDREAYIFRGNESTLGFWMVRISNFLVFSMTLHVIYAFNMYLIDLYTNEGKLGAIPKRLNIAKAGLVIGELLIIISQFTGLYYTFDESNRYQRAPGFVICYIIPLAILALQLSVVIQYFKRLSKSVSISLLLFTIAPILASVLQLFAYGLSLTNITIVGMALVLFIFAVLDVNEAAERAHIIEIEYLKEERRSIQLLFEQTTEALVSAIDAKDKYTHGHSTRVANYSRKLAERAGKSQKERDEIYYAALLHDVGKIGIPESIINKTGKLTDEEYDIIKQHPVIGQEILSKIGMSPFLRVGANYHHERYDGGGYPEGLKGEETPEIARIIAVADAYDAMTSKRSYRDPMSVEKAREEIIKGSGTQFDPVYAGIMVNLIDDSEIGNQADNDSRYPGSIQDSKHDG